jgi:hypothetical protein
MSSHTLSLLRKTAQQSDRLRWDNDHAPGAASRRARREESKGKE